MKSKFYIIALVLGVMFTSNSYSQSDYYSVWLDYNHDNKLNDKWSFSSDYGYRFRLDYDYFWERLHARTAIVYKMKNIKLLAGVAGFGIFEPDHFINLELRPWQGVKYTFKITPKFKLSNFVRLEERFNYLSDSNGLDYDYALVIFRYSLTAKYALNAPEGNKGKWIAYFGFEPFFRVAEQNTPLSVSKSRTTIGVSYSTSSKTKFKLGYIYQPKSIPILQDQVYYSNIVRLSVFQKF